MQQRMFRPFMTYRKLLNHSNSNKKPIIKLPKLTIPSYTEIYAARMFW